MVETNIRSDLKLEIIRTTSPNPSLHPDVSRAESYSRFLSQTHVNLIRLTAWSGLTEVIYFTPGRYSLITLFSTSSSVKATGVITLLTKF